MRSQIENSIFRLIVIYGYLLFTIIFILYFFPGLIDYNKNSQEEKNIANKNDYISGGYLKDTKLFNVEKMYFPVAFSGKLCDSLEYIDSYGYERTYGGDRKHEGCDIMTLKNKSGEYPIVAVCDGVIEQLGWLELGGYRIGLRSNEGVYYYFAHLAKYEEGIFKGKAVNAGEVIGYIGDTGYSKVEGTTGNFDVHLHFGIYLTDDNNKEYTVNPYPLLKKLENQCLEFTIK